MIAGGEYAYLSPVFLYSPDDGEVLLLRHVALTNAPALDLPQVALRAGEETDFSTEEEPPMTLLQQLLASLGLAKETSEADVLSAVAALKAKADQVDGLNAKVAALSSQAPDPSKFVGVETMAALQAEVAALTSQINGDKVTQVVEAALTAGKLLPAQKDWALSLGKANLAALTEYVEKTPAIAVLGGMQSDQTKVDAGGADQLSEAEMAVCKATGISAEDFIKAKSI
jgi:phage I-like protein